METLSLGWKICNHISEKKYKKPTEERQKDKKDGVVCCIEMVIWGEDIIKEFPLSRTVGDHHVSAGSGVSSSVRDHRWAGGLPSSNRPQVAAGTHLCPVPGKPLHFSVRPVWRGQHQGMSAVSEWVCVCVCVCVCVSMCVCVCVCVCESALPKLISLNSYPIIRPDAFDGDNIIGTLQTILAQYWSLTTLLNKLPGLCFALLVASGCRSSSSNLGP